MSVLVVGLSHRTAPLPLLERAALTPADAAAAGRPSSAAATTSPRPSCSPPATGWRSTPRSAASTAASARSARRSPRATGVRPRRAHRAPLRALRGRGGRAPVLRGLRPGLDGGRRGADPRPGPRRAARGAAARLGRAARSAGCCRHALRVGKRAHTETRLDRAGPSLVEAGLERAADALGPVERPARARGRRRRDERPRRGHRRARRRGRHHGRQPHRERAPSGSRPPSAAPASRWPSCPAALAAADVVLACAGRRGPRRRRRRRPGRAGRAGPARPQVYVDLALPRDVDPAAADVPGVTSSTSRRSAGTCCTPAGWPRTWTTSRALVADEASAYLAGAARRGRRADRGRAARAWPRVGRRRRAGPPAVPARRRRRRACARSSSRPCTGSSRSCCTLRRCG